MPTTTEEHSPVEQTEPVQPETIASDEISGQESRTITVSIQHEPPALVCVHCGAAYSPGKRFCRRCGQAIDAVMPVANNEPLPVEQAAHRAIHATISLSETEIATAPFLEPVAHDQTFPAAVDSAPSGMVVDPPLQAESGTTSTKGGFERNFLKSQNLSMEEGDSRPLFKFSGSEEESTVPSQFQADVAVHEHDGTNTRRDSRVDSDEADLPDPADSAVRRRRIFFLIIGAVCAAAVLGTVAFIATYHWIHRPPQIAMQSNKPVARAMSAVDQPSRMLVPTDAKDPVAQAKPVAQKQESSGHEAHARSTPPTKPNSANLHPSLLKSQESNCAFDSNMLSKMLDRADRNREQGNYPDAARQYRSVLDCDHNNARARSGLDLTLLDIQHQ